MAGIYRKEEFFGTGDEPKIAIVKAEHYGRGEQHSHEFYEIVYVADGFTLHSCEGPVKMMVTGDIFYIKPGEEHSYINAYQTKIYNLIFTKEALGELLPSLSVLPGLDAMFSPTPYHEDEIRILHADLTERRSIETNLEKIAAEQTDRMTGWQTSIKLRLASFLIRYARMFESQMESRVEIGADYYGYIYKMLEYVDEHYNEEITMTALSKVTGLSPDYMTRKFKAVMRMSPSEYVRKFRIARAMELLCTTDLSISEISRQTGFSDISLFSRVFKQTVGLPPASWRMGPATK